MKEEGIRKLRSKVGFQPTKRSDGGTWYRKDAENYSTALVVTFKTESTADIKLIHVIKESRQKLASSKKITMCVCVISFPNSSTNIVFHLR